MQDKMKIDLNWSPQEITDVKKIPIGDMPKDKININDGCIKKAELMFPKLLEEISKVINDKQSNKVVVSVYGGSGVGKSVSASLFAYYLKGMNIGTYIISGDNYPHRIPEKNDLERLRIFREYGIKGLVAQREYTNEINNKLKVLQDNGFDLDSSYCIEHPWLATYIEAGILGLKSYLGTKNEIDFDELNSIIERFKNNEKKLFLKRMGREEKELWYDLIDFSKTNVLIIEWTHGNNQYLKGVDIPILLHSTPEETLEFRRQRARDDNTDSPLILMSIDIEQKLLDSQAENAKLIINMAGEVITFEEYKSNFRILEQ